VRKEIALSEGGQELRTIGDAIGSAQTLGGKLEYLYHKFRGRVHVTVRHSTRRSVYVTAYATVHLTAHLTAYRAVHVTVHVTVFVITVFVTDIGNVKTPHVATSLHASLRALFTRATRDESHRTRATSLRSLTLKVTARARRGI
jgi:hypothetical protein